LKTAVERVLVENRRARGLRLASGETVRSPAVVLNADFLSATQSLVDPALWPDNFRRRVAALRPSCSAFAVHLGVRGAFEEARPILHVSGSRGSAGIVLPSLVDASAAPPGYGTVEILRLVPNDVARTWFEGAPRQTPAYRTRKKEIGDELIALAEEVLPGLSARIVYRADATPLTYQRYEWSSDGAIYGCAGAPGAVSARSPIPGIVFAGSATHGAGVEAVMISGANAAQALVPGLLASDAGYRAARRPAYGFAPVRNSIESGVPVSLNALRK
jgi:phytoene dehydrogenase-like protein